MPVLTRQTIIDALATGLAREPWILAATLGGSFATGRVDEYSDIDLGILVEDDRVEDAFVVLRDILVSLSPIEVEHRLPDPTWHGSSQVFVRLANASPHHFVDACVIKRCDRDSFGEEERHGVALVLFDREGLVRTVPLDREALAAKMRARLQTLRETYVMFQPLVERAVARGHVAEATYWYVNLTLKGLVEVLRMRHCPDRWDFGFRYLDRDLPAEKRRAVEALCFPRDAQELAAFRVRAEAMFREEIAALDSEP
ncbi:MAG: nucleotidyltransferase domain-containing protein [bacterium]